MFVTQNGALVPAVTADQMHEVDRIAIEEFGLSLLQMMENAGRNLALNAMDLLDAATGEVTILAGAGGNGGGGLCCARHLHNRGFQVNLVLDREARALGQAAASQLATLRAAGVSLVNRFRAKEAIRQADLVVDALIGYSLRGAPRGQAATLIELCNQLEARVLSLDVPSGLDATTGEAPGLVIRPERTLTLALPKTGLQSTPGELYLADIGLPPEVYRPLGIHVEPFWGQRTWLPLEQSIRTNI